MWTPLLEGAAAARAREVALEIALTCREREASQLGEHIGRAMLFDYVDRAGLADFAAAANLELDAAIALALERPPRPAMASGLVGLGWTVAHLVDAEDVLRSFDTALLDAVDPTWNRDYDLLYGLVGIGLYAIERLAAPLGRQLATCVIHHLERMARAHGETLFWWTDPAWALNQREGLETGYIDLGIAHGMPGIACFAAHCLNAGFEVARARRLLDGSLGYVLAAMPPSEPRFASHLLEHGQHPPPTRLAWCYGDLGVTLAIVHGGRATANERWLAEANELATGMARRPFETSGVRDPSFCHGTAGVGHILNRLAQALDHAPAREAARAWIGRTLDMKQGSDGIAGFSYVRTIDGQEVWGPEYGLLTGAPGIALVLLAASSELEPGWDRMFLCDVSPT